MKKLLLFLAILFIVACKKETIEPVINPFIGSDLIGMTIDQAGKVINDYGITNPKIIEYSNGTFREFQNDTVYILLNDGDIYYTYINYRHGFKINLQSILDYVHSNGDFVKTSNNHYIYKDIYQFEIMVNNQNIYLTTVKISQK